MVDPGAHGPIMDPIGEIHWMDGSIRGSWFHPPTPRPARCPSVWMPWVPPIVGPPFANHFHYIRGPATYGDHRRPHRTITETIQTELENLALGTDWSAHDLSSPFAMMCTWAATDGNDLKVRDAVALLIMRDMPNLRDEEVFVQITKRADFFIHPSSSERFHSLIGQAFHKNCNRLQLQTFTYATGD